MNPWIAFGLGFLAGSLAWLFVLGVISAARARDEDELRIEGWINRDGNGKAA